MTLQQAAKKLLFQLYHIYDQREAANIADLVMENLTEWKRIDRVLNKEYTLSPRQEALLSEYIPALSAHQPVQYVLKEAWFYGMKLYVDENVLIPRPETEELIEWIVEETRIDPGKQTTGKSIPQGIEILDIGTGSGCIALGLKKKLPLATIFACDVSEAALEVARKNALLNNAEVKFLQCDFLDRKSFQKLPPINMIVSNPPYIPMEDKTGMAANVLLHEPHLALFVDDDDPMLFYRAIASFASTNLSEGGSIYVEIHEHRATEVKKLFIEKGFDNVEIRKDMQGRARMIKAFRND